MKSTCTKGLCSLAIISLFSIPGIKAQEFKDKFFFSNGVSGFSELVVGRSIVEPEYYDSTYTSSSLTSSGSYNSHAFTSDKLNSFPAFSIFTYTANARYSIAELDNNTSVSLNIPLGVGVMISPYGIGSINIPFFIGYNTGNISTYSADRDKGFTVALGVEYYNLALYRNPDYKDIPEGLKGASFIEPCLNIGYRYWSKANVGRELNLKVGIGPRETTTDQHGEEYDLGKAIVFKLTFFFYSQY